MFSHRSVLALALAAAIRGDGASELHVLRTAPADPASPVAAITVTFDRPVAGSLDYTVDPASVVTIAPAVPGRMEWRDPVTIRFQPARPLAPNQDYAVTVGTGFRAMDGSRLAKPYTFSFRVSGPRALTGAPAGPDQTGMYLAPDAPFEVVYSAPVDLATLSRAALLEFASTCAGAHTVRLTATGQRPIGEQDTWRYREAGGYQRERAADSLRRVVRLVPAAPLPLGCSGALRVPTELDPELTHELTQWSVSVHGDFRIAGAWCAGRFCPTGPASVTFSTPVRGSEIQRAVQLLPRVAFTVRDTDRVSASWTLEARLAPRTVYALVADTSIRDVFGQRLTGNPAAGVLTTGYEPSVDYAFGRLTVERTGLRTLSLASVNVDTLVATVIPIPDSLEAGWLSRAAWGYAELWSRLAPTAQVQRIPVAAPPDRGVVSGLRLPTFNAQRPHAPTLIAVKVLPRAALTDSARAREAPIALLQVTDLGVHAKIGVAEGVVWVTGASDGKPRAGAVVTLFDDHARQIARATTDAEGIAHLSGYRSPRADNAVEEGEGEEEEGSSSFEGYVAAVWESDRALVSVSQYDPDLSPWHFNVYAAWGDTRAPQAGAVFAERGIYRPGEVVHAKAIVRDGALGALVVPPRGDSLRWVFRDREDGTLREQVMPLSSFGTADDTLTVPATASLGDYAVEIQRQRDGTWHRLARASYRVAEYRPPEFLVQMTPDSGVYFPGDTVRPVTQARYLFGAPMGRAAVTWLARSSPLWWLDIPHTDGFVLGDQAMWWEEYAQGNEVNVFASGTDTLDLQGRLVLPIGLPPLSHGRGARITIETTVHDVNRQVVGAATSVVVHPAAFYIGARPTGSAWFWTAGTAVTVQVIAVRPNGDRVPRVSVQGTVVRREWHQVRRDRDGIGELVGDWVSDTVARCAVTTGAEPVPCAFTPPAGGEYIVSFQARDPRGRATSTSFYRWAAGTDWVPWSDESQFKMDLIPDKTRYAVGDTATVLVASPFTDVEGWVTVEREGIIEQRRLRITSGATALKFPITEAYAPNAYVSVVVARGRSAPPGPRDDPGRPTIRVGYVELRVTPEVKRLTVDVAPVKSEYRPGDTARVRLHVRDVTGTGRRSEVTLWAVDEGVLSLTGYRTPDPIDLLYAERGLGMRLASNMVAIAPQVPEGLKGKVAPGGGGGMDAASVLRSRFQTTAFFLGSVVTDSSGSATASAKLPDNLTTFRVMAVAVTAGDRYGKGESPMLVTRPLLARPALPRFVRAGDTFAAGVVVNRRAGGTPKVKVTATTSHVTLTGDATRTATLAEGRGAEVRFDFRGLPGAGSIPPGAGDSATFQFAVTDGANADAVRLRLPIKPEYHPRAHTIAGVLRDSATATFVLPGDIDPARSRLSLSVGTSPLTVVRAAYWQMRVYPYYCSEQITSAARPLIALYRAQKSLGAAGAGALLPGDPRHEIETAVAVLSSRQRSDGGIGYWSATDWTTPWLSAYAGLVLLDARSAGVAVDDSVLARLTRYLGDAMRAPKALFVPVSQYYEARQTALADQVAAADFLSREGTADLAVENTLLRLAPQMAFEDRLRLAEVLARRGATRAAHELLAPAWALVTVEGRRATLPDSLRTPFYFESRVRPLARLLTATLAVDSVHPLIAPMVETLAQLGRAGALDWYWNTQDLAATVTALAAFERVTSSSAARRVRVRAGGRTLLEMTGRTGTAVAVVRPGARPPARPPAPDLRDSAVSLEGLVRRAADGTSQVTVSLDAPDSANAGGVVYYFLTVEEVPRTRPVTPDQAGIQVERWYEDYQTGKPLVSVPEGALVRVRLRLTVPADRDFVVLDDALPAGLEAVDLSLRTSAVGAGPGAAERAGQPGETEDLSDESTGSEYRWWWYGWWDGGWWSPFDHREIRDDRVVYFATHLWAGTYTASYIARATTPGVFIRPPAHAEEMYNPAVHGRSDGGVFTVVRQPEKP